MHRTTILAVSAAAALFSVVPTASADDSTLEGLASRAYSQTMAASHCTNRLCVITKLTAVIATDGAIAKRGNAIVNSYPSDGCLAKLRVVAHMGLPALSALQYLANHPTNGAAGTRAGRTQGAFISATYTAAAAC